MTINKEIEEAMKLVAGFMGFNWNKRSHKGSSVLIKEENGDLLGKPFFDYRYCRG